MCGRYVLFSSLEQLADNLRSRLGTSRILRAGEGEWPANFNVAPTIEVPIVREFKNEAAIGPARWGYPPKTVFNARGETAFSKPLFAGSVPCAFPMDGWYEWTVEADGKKQPWFSTAADNHPMYAAGLCKAVEGQLYGTIITVAALPELEWLHSRMPRILVGDELGAWLKGERTDMVASPNKETVVDSRKADRKVGSVANNYPELVGMSEG
ncbi:SOS response-associated peptidase [Corynebacterium sp. 22_2729]